MREQVAQIPEIVWQFAENCASLWEDRERAARSRVYRSTFADLCALDSRIDAQLDGLRVSSVEGRKVATEALELQGGGEIFTASVLAFENLEAPKADPIDRLLDSISKPGLAARPMTMALDWIAPEQAHSALERLSVKRLPLARAVTMMAQAARGIDCAPDLVAALGEADTFVAHAACWAAVRLGTKRVGRPLSMWFQSEDLETRLIAARSALLLGGHGASRVLEELVATSSSGAEEAAAALFHSCAATRALSLHRGLFGGLYSRASISAAGASGIPELVPFLLECLEYPPLSRLAGEAIVEITGVDLSKAGLRARKARGGGPSENPEDADIEIDQDEGLMWPEAEAVRSWWDSHSADFVPMTKHLAGRVVRSDMLMEYILRGGLQRRRATAAEMLALSGRPLFDVCAPAFRQTERLAGEDLCR
jgi:uncharacterized protein (TIGR02270 family)